MMALSASLQMDDSEFLRETAKESLSDVCELSNWIKYLQIVPDLLTLSTLVLDTDAAEKRTEIRYPLSKEFEGQIHVIYNGMLEAKLVNFSQKGIQIISSQPIEEGTVLQCHLMADVAEGTNNPFKATAMYCASVDGSNICGARITEMQGSGVFNFFSLVHQFMLDMTVDY